MTDDTSAPTTAPDPHCPVRPPRRAVPRPDRGGSARPDLPLSVWATAQRSSRAQRTGRYLPASVAHPAKMLPAVARQAVLAYTHPGDLVLDPMCGIGTTLVEAVHLGREAAGIEYEPRWAGLARANLAHAFDQHPGIAGGVATGDARDAQRLLDPGHLGRVRLLLTSPPYGSVTHGHVHKTADGRVGKANYRYSADPGNLAHRRLPVLLGAFTDILVACLPFLADDAVVAVTARPWRQAGRLVDFPAAVVDAAGDAGLQLFERNVALLAGIGDHRLVPRASFFALRNLRRARADGHPVHLVAHEDVLVFTRRA